MPPGREADPPEPVAASAGDAEEGVAGELDRLRAELHSLQERLGAALTEAEAARADAEASRWASEELARLYRTRIMRYSALLRRRYARLRQRRRASASASAEDDRAGYRAWVKKYGTLTAADRQAIATDIARMDQPPLISIVMPVRDTPERWLRRAIGSVQAQLYPHWQLCIADDGSTGPAGDVVAHILDEATASDGRIKAVRRPAPGGIVAASNSALELASGQWTAFVDHDDEIAEHALYLVAREIIAHPDAVLVYTDEDHVDEGGERYAPYFKCDWNPDLARSQNYVNHLACYRTDAVRAAGGLRSGLDGSQDHDLVLRVTEGVTPGAIRHVPFVCYHWRAVPGSAALHAAGKPYAQAAGRRAVADHLQRSGRAGTVEPAWPGSTFHRVRYELPALRPRVTAVVCTRDGRWLARCLRSVLETTDYEALDVLVVDNGSTLDATRSLLDDLAAQGRIRVLRDPRPFNYSALNNTAVAETDAELVLLLNDDTEALSPDWLAEMVGQVLQPGVGAVGALLRYPDDRIQHAGVVMGVTGVAAHVHRLLPPGSRGYFGRAALVQGFSAVTGACMLVRRAVFDAVGGLDEDELAVAFNDLDLCARIVAAGWRIVWTPYAQLRHYESLSRGPDDKDADGVVRFQAEATVMRRRWAALLAGDPAYNPNLSVVTTDFALAWPPRVVPPWRPEVAGPAGSPAAGLAGS